MYKELTAYLCLGAITSFLITKYMTAWLIPKLKSIKLGQKILDIGPRWHKNKEGTPTMGGLAFLLAFAVVFTVLAVLAGLRGQIDSVARVSLCAALMLFNGAIGCIDDYAKFFKKQNQGLTAGVKFLMQVVVAAAFSLGYAWTRDFATTMKIPFVDAPLDLGWGWYIISVLLITGVVNAVNLTDGLDGLASSVTFFVSLFFVIAGSVALYFEVVILASVLIGITLGFLVYNLYPAKIFMGDTGSLFLGAGVISMAYLMNNPLISLIVGFIYVVEAASVIIQVGVYKMTKKRIFKMAPIHHHFERCEWSELKVVSVFSIVTVICSVIAYMAL